MDNCTGSYRRFCDEGDMNALADIIKNYMDGLILYLNSIVGNIHTAEDLAEDTFVLLGTKKPKDKGGGSFRTWLYTIGRNIALDYLRKSRRHSEIPMDETADIIADTENLESSYIREERKIAVHHAMKQLRPNYRQVLWLIYFEGFTNKEAAAVMRKSVHNIESMLSRARQSLRKQLEMEGFEYEEP